MGWLLCLPEMALYKLTASPTSGLAELCSGVAVKLVGSAASLRCTWRCLNHAASNFDLVKPNAWKPTAGEPATGNLSPQRKTMEPPTIKPKTVNRQKTNWKPTNLEAANRQTKSRWWTRSHRRFAMVVVTKRWAVSRLEDTKPSTIGINWREQEGAYKKG